MGGKSKAPPPPDYGPVVQLARENMDKALGFFREYMASVKENEAENRKRLDQVLAVQLPIMQEQFDIFKRDRQRYEQTFQPVEDRLVEEAMTYDTPERIAAEQGRVLADVNKAFDAQRQAALQNLESYGVDPTQTRYAALDRMSRIGRATAAAQGMNQAKLQTEAIGRGLRADVANIGRGYPGQAAAAAGQAVGTGSTALGGALNTAQTAAQLRQGGLAGLGMANQGVGQIGNLMNTGYQNQMQQWNANFARSQAQFGNMLGLGGLAAGFFSDGGEVDGPTVDGSGVDDAATIRVSDGEYVIPADVVKKKGTEFFDKLIEKYHTPAEMQRMRGAAMPPDMPMGPAGVKPPGYADGGAIPSQYDYLLEAPQAPMTMPEARQAALEPVQAPALPTPASWRDRVRSVGEAALDYASNRDLVRPMTLDELRDPYYIAEQSRLTPEEWDLARKAVEKAMARRAS